MDEFKPPARRAMAVLDTPEPDSVPAPKRRVSRKLIAAIDAMVMGECKDVTQAAAKVGMARESVSRALRKPHISQLLRSKTRQRLDTAAARAGAVKVELLTAPTKWSATAPATLCSPLPASRQRKTRQSPST
jgi:DNA-binding phage protein